MLKVAACNDLDSLDCQSLGMSWQIPAQSGEGGRDRHQWQGSLFLPWDESPRIWCVSFYCTWRKAICKSLSTNMSHGWLDFHFFFSPKSSISGALAVLTLGKWQFSLICEGPPEPSSRPWNEFISPQWDANDWCYNNITPCHNHLCILKGEEMCCFCHFLSLVSPLERTMTPNTNPWKGSGA